MRFKSRSNWIMGGVFTLCAQLVTSCFAGGPGSTDDEAQVDAQEQAILRATSLGGRNEVVMLQVTVDTGSGLTSRTCSGVYFAPRVVLTAAHCLQDVFLDQVFVYYGDNFTQDLSQLTPSGSLFVPPPPGQPSTWAKADSFEVHPQWDPSLLYPDLGAVYLDRKLPFEPLPVARFRLDDTWLNKQVTISGWGADQTPTPTTGSGLRVQRTGKTFIAGSPTDADYHPEDPNPGMLMASVRQNTLKTDGRAPNSNSCFGDSGGPLIVNRQGQDYAAGVSYFTGLSCEDYSIYVRLDPFLPFIDRAARRGGQSLLSPIFECVTPTASGYRAFFGYNNQNGVSLSVPHGSRNSVPRDTLGLRPTHFLPGEHHFTFAVDFAANQSVSYLLAPENNQISLLAVGSSARRCGAAEAGALECASVCLAAARSGCQNSAPFASCESDCLGAAQFFGELFPPCVPLNAALNQCLATVPAGVQNWFCQPGATPQPAAACEAEANALYACMGI